MRSRFDGAGYLLVDNRASGGVVEEADLIACGHCGGLIAKPHWVEDGGYCHGCDTPLCGADLNNCAAKPGCTPEMARLERAVEDDYRRRQNARMLGI